MIIPSITGIAQSWEVASSAPGLAIAMLSKGKGFGNWLRLLGRHHTHAHWTRVYDLEQGAWLDSTQAIKYILSQEVARPLSQVATNLDQPLRFTRVDAARRQELTRRVEQFREFRQQRVKQELQAVRPRERANERDPARALAKSANPPGADARPRQAERFRSPIAAPAAPSLAGTNPGPRTINQGEPRTRPGHSGWDSSRASGNRHSSNRSKPSKSDSSLSSKRLSGSASRGSSSNRSKLSSKGNSSNS